MRREPSPGFQTHHLDRPTGGPTGTAGTTRPALGSCSPPNLPPAPSLPPWGPRPPSPPDPCRLTPRLRAAGGPHGSVSPPSVSKQALLLQEPPRGLGHAAGREGQLGQPGQPLSPSTPPLKHSCRSEALSPPLAGHPPTKSANSLTSLWVTCALQHFPQEGPENRVESATCCLCLWVPCPAREGPGADSSLSVHPATGRPWVPHHVLLPSASTMEACPSPSDALTRCVSINGRWAGRLWKSLVLGRQGCRSAHLRMRPPAPPEEMKLLQCQAHTKVNAALAVTPPHSPRPVQDAQ